MNARALYFTAPREIELRSEALRAPGPGEVLVRSEASCVSEGTEMLLYRGEGPDPFDPSLGDARATPTYPRRYGYALVGRVEARGDGVSIPQGSLVFALAPHGEAHVLDARAVRPLPDDVPAERATLAASLETALTCTWDCQAVTGESAVVLGGGTIGILTAWLLARADVRVTLVEPREARRASAEALSEGLDVDVVPSQKPRRTADLVVEATGDPSLLDTAIAWCRAEARVVVASFYGKRRAPVDLGGDFHRKRLSLVSSQVSSIPPRLRGRWDAARRFTHVAALLREPGLDALLDEPVPFERAAELYREIDGGADVRPARVFVYR